MTPPTTPLRLVGTQLSDPGGPRGSKPLLVLGPSLGTSVTALWSVCATHLADRYHLIGWDLPGHGATTDPADGSFDVADLAQAVLQLVDAVQAQGGEQPGQFAYAGDSAGGAVGLQLLLDAPERVSRAVLLCTSARFGEPADWHERAALVRGSGTPAVVELSARRWFGPGFLQREPATGAALLHALQEADAEGYARVCEALAAFDVRDRLGQIEAPVLAVAGSHDCVTPPGDLAAIVSGVQRGRLVVLEDIAHLAPAEAPSAVARLVDEHLAAAPAGEPGSSAGDTAEHIEQQAYDAGLAVRREVLGHAHVDRAMAATTDFTREFQELITRYAWGTIWTRPGLDRRSRSMITLTALIARGHHEELALHVRAARRNGLSDDEIKEVILQSAIYCGVPDANTAFRIAQDVLAEPPQNSEERQS